MLSVAILNSENKLTVFVAGWYYSQIGLLYFQRILGSRVRPWKKADDDTRIGTSNHDILKN
jgi:hypothetical protein